MFKAAVTKPGSVHLTVKGCDAPSRGSVYVCSHCRKLVIDRCIVQSKTAFGAKGGRDGSLRSRMKKKTEASGL